MKYHLFLWRRMVRMEVASSRPDHLPTLSVDKASKLSLLAKLHILAIDEASQQQQQRRMAMMKVMNRIKWIFCVCK